MTIDFYKQMVSRHMAHKNSNTETSAEKPTAYYFDAYMRHKDKTPILREALALQHFWEQAPLLLSPHELLAGVMPNAEGEIAGFFYGSGTYLRGDLLPAYAKGLTPEAQSVFWKKIAQMKENHFTLQWCEDAEQCRKKYFTPAEAQGIVTGAASSTFFYCHMVMDYESLLHGLGSYRRDIDHYLNNAENPEFYLAMKEILVAFTLYIKRTADACLALSETSDTALRAYMLYLHEELMYITEHPPKTFVQALHLVWLAHLCAGGDTFGRLDQYLYPFYKNDLANGVITEEIASYYLQSLMIKIEQATGIQSMTIGGITPQGDLAYNDITRLIMEAVRVTGGSSPNLCFRINSRMPAYWWDEIMASLQTGQGLPALYNDDIMIAQLTGYGVTLEDAQNYCLGGCSQVMIPGKSQFANDIGIMNIAKILELTLYNGVDLTFSNEKTDCQTGNVEQFTDFDALWEAFCEQLTYYARLEAAVNNKILAQIAKTEGYAFRTLFTQACLSKGKAVFAGGAVYNGVELECIGVTNASDSLMAIKKEVYENKSITLPELCQALLADFKGYESLRRRLLEAPKFGNDLAEADDMRNRITTHLFGELRKQPAVLGGYYIPGEVIFIAHDALGQETGATPDGRRKGQVLADSAGAMQGQDQSGSTALFNSILSIPTERLCTSIVLNVKFLKQSFQSDAEKITHLFRTYFAQGGQQLQVNVCDRQQLLAALKNPEEHRNLVVRVGGYSAYFHTLSENLREEIVARNSY